MRIQSKIYFFFALFVFFALTAFNFKDLKKDLKKAKEKVNQVKAVTGKFTEKDETEMGAVIISSLLGAAPLVNDLELQRYVNNVGYWVSQQSNRAHLPWTFGVLDNENINAFAAPGGYILITKGLMQYLQSEAELAAVLAHEIIHVEEKHHLEVLKKSSRVNLLAEWGGNQTDSKYVGRLVNASTNMYSLGLDKKAEFDADLKSVTLMAKSGYDPYAMLDMLTTLASIKSEAHSLALLSKTHPSFNQRIERLDKKIDMLIPQQHKYQRLDQRYLKIKERL